MSASRDGERERRGDDLAADPALQEQAPGAWDGDEHADRELARRRRRAGHARAADQARAAARSWGADVRMEVVERPLAEEDRVRERPEPRRERRRLPCRVRDREVEERRLDRMQPRRAMEREPDAVDGLGRAEGGERLRPVRAGNADRREELEVRYR